MSVPATLTSNKPVTVQAPCRKVRGLVYAYSMTKSGNIYFSRMTKTDLELHIATGNDTNGTARAELAALYNHGWIYHTKDEMAWYRWTH